MSDVADIVNSIVGKVIFSELAELGLSEPQLAISVVKSPKIVVFKSIDHCKIIAAYPE